MKSTNPEDYQYVAKPIAAMPCDYPAGHHIARHSHPRGQILLASGGTIEITANTHLWVVPHGRAVWIPANVMHSVHIISAVTIESLYISAQVETVTYPPKIRP